MGIVWRMDVLDKHLYVYSALFSPQCYTIQKRHLLYVQKRQLKQKKKQKLHV